METLLAFWSQIVALCRKELLALLKDPQSRILLFAPPIVQTLLFGYAASFDLADVPYAVLDQSRGEASSELLARIDGSGTFERKATLASSHQIATLIDSREVLLVIAIPADFEDKVRSGEQAPLQLILDGRNSTTASMASSYLGSVVTRFNAERAGTGGVSVVRIARYNPNLESRWNILPALVASLAMLQVMMLSALTVAREREQGTFDQLLVTPLTPLQILIGKALPSILVGVMQSSLIVLVNLFWFGLPFNGSILLLYVGLLSFTAAAVGIGLSISAIALNMQQAMLYTFFIMMPLMLLSGLITPIRNMPYVLQLLTYANPLRFAMDMVRRVILEGAGFADVGWDFVPQLAVSAVTLPLAAWLFRNRLS